MNTKYVDLVDQTFDFPQEEFALEKDHLRFHGIDLNKLVETYGVPLKFTYLPKISDNIKKAKTWLYSFRVKLMNCLRQHKVVSILLFTDISLATSL